jgi:hypothetical protein
MVTEIWRYHIDTTTSGGIYGGGYKAAELDYKVTSAFDARIYSLVAVAVEIFDLRIIRQWHRAAHNSSSFNRYHITQSFAP